MGMKICITHNKPHRWHIWFLGHLGDTYGSYAIYFSECSQSKLLDLRPWLSLSRFFRLFSEKKIKIKNAPIVNRHVSMGHANSARNRPKSSLFYDFWNRFLQKMGSITLRNHVVTADNYALKEFCLKDRLNSSTECCSTTILSWDALIFSNVETS